jgi:tRNA threonylcarbamoyladenosine biosynthesis protein TsaB
LLLAIDTSTLLAGVALYDGVQVLSEVIWHSPNHHTVELAPVVADVLERSGVKAPELKAVGVATGPGSFTGLRIGLAFAKGLVLAWRIPLIGIPTLDILAAAQPVMDLPLAAVLQAGRGRLAVGWYEACSGAWKAHGSAEILEAQALAHRIHKPTLVCGELSEDERRLFARKRKNVLLASPAQSTRRPAFLAELAWQRWQVGQTDSAASLAPDYLHVGDPIPNEPA